jgi:hypothetical protein
MSPERGYAVPNAHLFGSRARARTRGGGTHPLGVRCLGARGMHLSPTGVVVFVGPAMLVAVGVGEAREVAGAVIAVGLIGIPSPLRTDEGPPRRPGRVG